MADKPASNLIVLTFEGQQTAEALYKQIEQMEKDKLVVIDDAVIVEREPHYETPAPTSTVEQMRMPPAQRSHEATVRVKQTHGKKGKYAAIGGGIGLIGAAILGGPIGLAVVGTAGIGAIAAALKDFGVNDETVDTVKKSLAPDTSALLALGSTTDRDALMAKLREYNAKVIMTSLDPEVERELVDKLQS